METLKQCEKRVRQLQSQIVELERENARLQAENIHLQAENQTLRTSSARFRALFEQSPLSIQILSPDGRIQQVNRAWEQLFHSTPREIPGHYNMLADTQLIEKQVMTLIKRGFAGEVVIVPPIRYDAGQNVAGGADGRATWAHGILYPIKDEVGHVVEVVLVHQDTTDWLRAEQARREAEAEKQAAILLERERAALERVAELAKANDVLRQTLDVLATDSDLERFVGQVLKAVAEQFDAPVAEYWSTSKNIAYLELSCWQGEIVTKEQLSQDPRTRGIEIPPEMVNYEDLEQRQRYFIVEYLPSDPIQLSVFFPLGFDLEAWCKERGVRRLLNIPLRLGNKSIGALTIYIGADRRFTDEQIELAYALAQQVTLAIRLNQLAESAQQAAIAREQEKAALERAAELAQANDALKRNISKLAEEPQLDAFLCNVMTVAAEQVGACSSALFVYDENTHTLSMKAEVDDGQPVDIATAPRMEIWRVPVPADITPAWELISREGGLLIHETDESDPNAWPQSIGWHRMMGNVSVLCLPLVVGGRSVGFIGFCFKHRADVVEEKVELARALTHQATLALELTRLADQARQSAVSAAIAKEQEKAALEQVAALVKANDALKQSLDVLATEPELDKFIGHVLGAIAEQIPSPLTEYWYHPEGDIAYIGMMSWQGRVYSREEIAQLYPTHPGIVGFHVTPELIHGESLQHRKRYFISDDWHTNSLIDSDPFQSGWEKVFGVIEREINIPMTLGDNCIGALVIRLPRERQFTTQQIELAQALVHQTTLAVQLTSLAESAKLAAIAREQELAALERAAELTKLNAALSASEARLRTLFEQIPVSLQIFGNNGVCLEVNSAWSELWQLPSSAVIGKSCLVTRSNPESQLPSPFTPYLQRCFAGEAVVVPPLLFDPVGTFKVGRPRWVQTYIYPIKDQANRLREVLLIHQDIHALKQAEQVARGQTEALIKVLSALVSEPDIDQLLPSVMSITTAQLNAPASTLWLCDTQTGFNLLHLVCCGDLVSRELPVRMRADIDSLCLLLEEQTMQQMERTSSPIVLTDIATHPALEHLRPWLLQQQVRALMLVPLLLGNQLIGCVGIHNSTSNYFRCEEISLAQALAHQITLAFQLTQLAQQARLAALFEERNRIAGEIHDTLAQTFTGISIQLDVAKRIVSQAPQEARQILERVGELAHLGLKEAKRSVWALYSPTTLDADLAQSLRHSVEQMTNDTEIAVEFNVEGTPCSLTMDVSQNLLRMGQEAVTNILKHAQARAIWIELVYEAEYVCLSVRDDGRGFVLSAAAKRSGASFGLIGMYQRAERIGGELTITTQPGQGTEISVRVPVS